MPPVAAGSWLEALGAYLDALYAAPYRRALVRARRDEEDLFMLLVFCELLGIPNPVQYYTLELMPLLVEDFHAWHLRMGMDRSPLEHLRCC